MSEKRLKEPEKKLELTDEQLEPVAGGTDALPADQIVIIDNYLIHHVVINSATER